MSTLKSQAEARQAAEEAEKLKKRAARQAAKIATAPHEIPTVECVVLPMGDGKISMGQHVGGMGEAHYEVDEKFTVEIQVAQALKDRGYVNFKAPADKVLAA
jgi:pyrimidine deaminase RibD-like protein